MKAGVFVAHFSSHIGITNTVGSWKIQKERVVGVEVGEGGNSVLLKI